MYIYIYIYIYDIYTGEWLFLKLQILSCHRSALINSICDWQPINFFQNNLVRCGSFFSFPENIMCKHSQLFAIYFSVTSIGLDIKHSMQNQNMVVSESDIKLFS